MRKQREYRTWGPVELVINEKGKVVECILANSTKRNLAKYNLERVREQNKPS